MLFATPVTLLLVPSLYMVMTDFKQAASDLPARLLRQRGEQGPAGQE